MVSSALTTYYYSLPTTPRLATKVVHSTVLLQTIFRQEDASLQAALSEVRRAQDGARAPTQPAALCNQPSALGNQP